jgi:hypothetical protein
MLDRLKEEYDKDPVKIIIVSSFAVMAAAKLLDALSSTQSRAAYARKFG